MDGSGNFLYVKVNWHLGLLEGGVSSLPGGVGQYIHCGILAGVEKIYISGTEPIVTS